ncbi:MAG: calcium-binding protein [Oscillatoriaceae cyanobacterium Prado104]|nr:calcium-binding protein [Oscillatoriaceae cyanobacterium Prado104]
MANYDIFDEQYYLSQYPWLKPAIDAGIIKSGREHFEKFGQAAGLTSQDIAPFVRNSNNPNAPFATGLDHFIKFGYEEGRSRVSPDYDEAFYLKRYPVLVPFVQNGTFKSGYQHFVKFGAKEGLYASSFFEPEYLLKNSDVATAVKAGFFQTGGEHYRKFGQFEPTRSAAFVGTKGEDIITGFGVGKVEITGIQVSLDAGGNRVYEKSSYNEKGPNDTLMGGQGSDTFILGANDTLLYSSIFGFGAEARIKNFDRQADKIRLAGTRGWYNYRSDDTGK